MRNFFGLRFFNFDDHLAFVKNTVAVGLDHSPNPPVFFISEPGTDPGPGLDIDLVSSFDIGPHALRR
jgi:hypothetical protein